MFTAALCTIAKKSGSKPRSSTNELMSKCGTYAQGSIIQLQKGRRFLKALCKANHKRTNPEVLYTHV
jgi:hypothetical protein